MGDTLASNSVQVSTSPPTATPAPKSIGSIASPRKQGRFLVIEPPKLESDEESYDSASAASLSPRDFPSPIQARFGLAMGEKAPASQPVRHENGGNSSAKDIPHARPAGSPEGSAAHTLHDTPYPTNSPQSSGSASSSSRSPLDSRHDNVRPDAPAQTQGSPTQQTAPLSSSSSSTQPSSTNTQAFLYKNTDGPLIDPSFASAMGWDDDEDTGSSSSERLAEPPPDPKEKLLPPMSPYGNGQLSQRERERIRKDWLHNIIVHKAEQEKLSEKLRREKATQAAQAAQAAKASSKPDLDASSSNSLDLSQVPVDSASNGAMKSPSGSSSKLSTTEGSNAAHGPSPRAQMAVLDLPTYQAAKKRASDEAQAPTTPGRVLNHRRSASDITLEARVQVRRESGPPPPRPGEDINIARKESTKKLTEPTSPGRSNPTVRIDDSAITLDLSVKHTDTLDNVTLVQSLSDPAITDTGRDTTDKPKTKPTKERDDKLHGRGRSASVSKRIGGLFGRLFDSKPKHGHVNEAASTSTSPNSKKSHKTKEVASPSGSAAGSPASSMPQLSGLSASASTHEDDNESISSQVTSPPTDSLQSSEDSEHTNPTISSSDRSLSKTESINTSSSKLHKCDEPAMAPLSASSPQIAPPLEHDSMRTASSSSPNVSPAPSSAKANRPKPPIPPKPDSLSLRSKTMRPSTKTKVEFGLD